MLTDGCGTRLSECQGDRLAKHPGVKTRKWGKKRPERRKTKLKQRTKSEQEKEIQNETGLDRQGE